jgi:cytochrome b561
MPVTSARYTRTAMLLHWFMALLIFFLFGLGWYMADLPETSVRAVPFSIHKSVGLLVFTLLWVRLFWRLKNPPPVLPSGVEEWKRALSCWVHRGFYALLVLQPVTGYLSASFSGHKTNFFGIPLPHWGWKNTALNDLFTDLHAGISNVLLIFIIVHVLGAISHMLQRDGVIYRMLPLRPRE